MDDRSRVAFSQILADETGQTAARFLVEAAAFFAEHGVRIQRVLTDNAKAYTESVVFAETAADLGIGLKRTRPYRPQTNGKVERFNRTLLDEWPTRGCTAPTPSAGERSAGGCGSTITADHTPRSTASPRWRSSSTTLIGNTPRAWSAATSLGTATAGEAVWFGDEEVVELVLQGEFALLHERLNARRPEPIRDDIAAIEFMVLAGG